MIITSTGSVKSTEGSGITAHNSNKYGASLTVNAANSHRQATTAFLPINRGKGDLTINTTGLVKSTSTSVNDGIHAGDYGPGDLIIISTGSVTGGNDGIEATGMDKRPSATAPATYQLLFRAR